MNNGNTIDLEAGNDTREFQCPANTSHKIIGDDNLLKHIMRCKDFEGRKFWVCKYQWTHMFHGEEERNHHETKCEFIKPGVDRYKDFFFLNKQQDSPDKFREKQNNITNSRYYYHKNKQKLEHEKQIKRKIREKREQEEANKIEQNKEALKQSQELGTYYSKDYVVENSFYISLDWGSSFMVQVKLGDRKLDRRNFEMAEKIELGDKLANISQLEYQKLLGGEFIANPDHAGSFEKLKKNINSDGPLACLDYCDSNDELIILTTSKYIPYLPETRIAIIVMLHSKFMMNERPYHIPENNVSRAFVNEYGRFLQHQQHQNGPEHENINAEHTTAIVLYEYKQRIANKLKAIIELTQEATTFQNAMDQTKKEGDELQALLSERESLEAHQSKLTQKEERMKKELDNYKSFLINNFQNTIQQKQEDWNNQINRFYAPRLKQLEEIDRKMQDAKDEEARLIELYSDNKIQSDMKNKKRRRKEQQIGNYEQMIAEKKKTIEVSKSLALTNVLDSLCHICQHNRINILYLPCGHFYVCEDCQKKATEIGRHECLYCSRSLEKVLRVLV